MKRKIITKLAAASLGLSVFMAMSSPVHSATQRVSDDLSLSLTDSGVLTSSNSYLTNYIVRGLDQTTGEQGTVRFLKRSDKAVDFDFADVTEWDGFFPANIDFKMPVKNVVNTTIDLSAYNYAGDTTWENSDLVFRGASLVDLVTSFPTDTNEAIDTLTLFLMNALTLTETSLGVVQNLGSIQGSTPETLVAKIQPLAEKIVAYKDEISKAGLLADMTSVTLEQVNFFASASGINPTDDPFIDNLFQYNNVVVDALDKLKSILGSTVAITAGKQDSIRGTIAQQYREMLGGMPDATIDEVMTAAASEFSSLYQQSTTDTEKALLVGRYMIEPLSKTVGIYHKLLIGELKTLKDSGASADQIAAKQSEIDFFRNGRAILQIASVIYATPDFLDKAKNEPQTVVPMMWEIATAVADALITQDNIETTVKNSWQRITGLDGRKSSYHAIRKGVRNGGAYMKAFTAGSEIGNSLIPLLWDLVFAPNRLQTSIVESQFSPYGILETEVQIYKQELSGAYTLLATASNTGQQNLVLPLTPADTIEVRVGLRRPLQFEATRAPWVVNTSYTPGTLYDVRISAQGAYQQDFLCVRRIVGNTDFSLYDRSGVDWSPLAEQCGSGTWWGGNWYDGSLPGSTTIEDPDLLPAQYQLGAFYTDPYPISRLTHTYQSADSPLEIAITGLNSNLIQHIITLVPALENMGFVLEQSTTLDSTVVAEFDTSQITASTEDPIEQYEWRWGDGSLPTITTATLASYEYDQEGQYTVTLIITTQSGATTAYEQVVDIALNVDAQLISSISFSDPNLATCVAATGAVYVADLTSLNCTSQEITDLGGIDSLTSLTTLYLGGNQIVDISALSTLTGLTGLTLDANQISDISALSTLTGLTGLLLNANPISDISALSSLTSLTHLRIYDNQISDIAALGSLTSLTILFLNGNQIVDISALSTLTNLSYLYLSANQISDISGLSSLTSLTDLSLAANQIVDIAALGSLTSLTDLDLSFNQIADISTLGFLTSLIDLSLNDNQISDISVLSSLTSLTTLYLDDNQISDISTLSSLTGLRNLILDRNQISDISALSSLTGLLGLYLDGNQIVDISALSSLTNPAYLRLSNNNDILCIDLDALEMTLSYCTIYRDPAGTCAPAP